MSELKVTPYHQAIPGLRIKRRLSEKIIIEHAGETLVIQLVEFHSANQIMLAFQGDSFKIFREEAKPRT